MSPLTEFQVHRIPFLDGGLVTSISPRLIEQNIGIASEVLNLDFSKPGIPTKRPGTLAILTPVVDQTIISVFEYLKTSTGTKHTMVHTEEGNLYCWCNINERWRTVKEGLEYNTPMWFINFADRVIMCNGVDPMMAWDGENLEELLGEQTASLETFFPYDNGDLVFTAAEAGDDGNKIQIEFVTPEDDLAEPTVVVTGDGEDEPPLITVTLAYKAKVPHVSVISLGKPIGGTYLLGNVFEKKEFAFDATAEDIKSALDIIYGKDVVESVEESSEKYESFVVTFNTNIINPYLRADFKELIYEEEELEGDDFGDIIIPDEEDSDEEGIRVVTNYVRPIASYTVVREINDRPVIPSVFDKQEFEWDEILSTANDIKALLDDDETVSNIITVEHLRDSTGEGKVATLDRRNLTGGYDSPVGKYLTLFKNRILMVGADDMLISSHTGDPTLWDPANVRSNSFIAYIGTNDGTRITGILDLGDGGLLIGKDSSLYGMFGYTRENFVVDLIDSSIGVVGHKTMQFIKPYAIFVAKDGIYRYEIGSIPERISDPIRDIFEEQVDHERVHESASCVYNRSYLLTMPTKDGGRITLVYYPVTGQWTMWDEPHSFSYGQQLDFNNKIMFADNSLLKVTRHDVSLDNHIPVPVQFVSMELDANMPEVDKYYGDLYIGFRTVDEPYNVSVEIAYNGGEFFPVATGEIIEGRPGKQKLLRIVLGREARFLEVRLTNEKDKGRHFSPLFLYYTFKIQELL